MREIGDALAPFLPAHGDRPALTAQYIAVGAEVEREAYRPYRDVLVEASSRLMTRLGHPLSAAAARILPDSLPGWRPFPEAPGVLRALRAAGCRIAILSNVDRDLITASIARLGTTPDLVVTAGDCRSYKPAPGHWKSFQDLSGAPPARTVHVGASLRHDMIPAGAFGYRTVFINRHDEPVAPPGSRASAAIVSGSGPRSRRTRVGCAPTSDWVICTIGDGSIMYTVQALWTAARYRIPATVLVVDNRAYQILKDGMAQYGFSVNQCLEHGAPGLVRTTSPPATIRSYGATVVVFPPSTPCHVAPTVGRWP